MKKTYAITDKPDLTTTFCTKNSTSTSLGDEPSTDFMIIEMFQQV